MRGRNVGISSIKRREDDDKKKENFGKTMEENKISSVVVCMNNFKSSIEVFASKHRSRINEDPEFRLQFHHMCVSVGVDPLASSKGFLSTILGIGDFFYELGVVIIEIAVQTRSSSGGIISLKELLQRIHQLEGKSRKVVTIDDIRKSIEKLSILGSGYKIIEGNQKNPMLLSVPLELNADHEVLINEANTVGYISRNDMTITTGIYRWSEERFVAAIYPLLCEGIVWLDDYNGIQTFYLPSLLMT